MMSPWIRLAAGWLTLFVVGTDLFVISPLLPSIAADYTVAPGVAGLSVTVFSVTYMMTAPLLGAISDRVGRRRMLMGCLVAFALANLLTAAAGNFYWLLAARVVAGATTAGIAPSVYALVGEAAPPERRATWMAICVSGLLMSLSVGVPIGALAGASAGWPSVFVALAVLSVALAGLNRRVWAAGNRAADAAAARGQSLSWAVLALRLAPMVAWSTALYGVYTYIGTGLTGLGYSTEQIARAILFYGAGALAGTLIGGQLADRVGPKFTTGLSLLGLGGAFFLLRPVLDAGWSVDLLLGLVSALAQLFFPAQQASLARDFPGRRATVLAWNNSAFFLGISLGSLVGAQALAVASFQVDITLCASLAVVGWLVNWIAVPATASSQLGAAERSS